MKTLKLILMACAVTMLFVQCSSHKKATSTTTTTSSVSSKAISLDALKKKQGEKAGNKTTDNKNKDNDNNGLKPTGEVETGGASYYADKYDGRATASGETFRQNKFTAAHKTLKFGTMVRVKNLKNGKTVDVKINDRGPFVKGRIIDLSRAAAEKIGLVQDGVAQVEVYILK
ncbi:MAG: septal ring lytic transglycosylase RlpA family protein [Bacteroidales bacterium]|nr:septal ring lytic transglycosylase RlpA family protein [Bacteroidales bacterium]